LQITDADNDETKEIKEKLKKFHDKLKSKMATIKEQASENADKVETPAFKSIEELVEEETQKIRDTYPNPSSPPVYLKLLRALEPSTWARRMVGSFKQAC